MNIFKKTLHKITTGLAVGTFAVAVLMTLSAPAQAAGQERVVTQASKADVDALSAKIRKSMPGLVIDSLKPSVVPGLWELVSGGDVAYFTADGVHMIQGTMFNVADRRNISEDALTDQRVKALNSISKEALIVYPAKGKAKHTITVFTDPSCPFCKRLHQDIASLNDLGITVQYAPYARSGNGTLTSRQLQEVLCSKDTRLAMDGFMDAPNKNSSGAECKAAQELSQVSQVANMVGLKGTPHIVADSGKAFSGYMPAKELLAALQAK